MRTVEVIVTNSGKHLLYDADGFIVHGAITKPSGGGLFGSVEKLEALERRGLEPCAYTVEEFLDGLYLDPYKLKEYAELKIRISEPAVR